MEVKIFDYGMNGEGIAKSDDGKLLFVSDALMDEEIDAEIFEEKGNYARARVKKILKESKHRITPHCPYFYQCGGCDLQHMAYDEQLKFKAMLVKKTIKKIAGLEIELEKIVPSENQFNYRNKIALNVVKGKIGFFKKNSHDLIEIDSCKIASAKINDVIAVFRKYLKEKDKEYSKELQANLHVDPSKTQENEPEINVDNFAIKTKNSKQNPLAFSTPKQNFDKNPAEFSSKIKNIVVREIDGQILVGIVAKSFIDIRDFYEILSKNFDKIGLYLIINTRKDTVVLDGSIKFVGGLNEIKIENFNLKYTLNLMSFHQTNLDIQNKIYNETLALVPQNSVVVNGFSGAGLLSALISQKARQVFGIEIEKSAHKDAEKLKQLNGIKNMSNICGDFLKKFPLLRANCDLLILDPSKKGCGEKIMREIFDIKQIIYISCNPIALAKDLRILEKSYIIDKVFVFDMFPNTVNVETLISLKIKE